MKTRLLILISAFSFLLSGFAQSTNRVTAHIVVTKGASNGFTFTANSSTRTVTQQVTSASTQILTNHTVAGAASNLYYHILANGFAGPLNVGSYTNGASYLTLRAQIGQSLTVSGLSNWFTVTYTTQALSGASGLALRSPLDSEPVDYRTNVISDYARGMKYSTSAIPTNIKAMENFATVASVTTLDNNTLKLDDINNVVDPLFQIADAGGSTFWSFNHTNGYDGIVNSNHVSRIGYTETLARKTLFKPSIQGGSSTTQTLNSPYIATPTIASPTFLGGISYGLFLGSTNLYLNPFGDGVTNLFIGPMGLDVVSAREVLKIQQMNPTTTLPARSWNFGLHQYGVGYSINSETIMRYGDVPANHTNNSHYQEMTLRGQLIVPSTAYSTLANGNNIAVDFGTNGNIRLTGTNTSVTLCGVKARPDGAGYRLENRLAGPLTITMNTADPGDTNRFWLYGGIDVVIPIGGVCWITYSTTLQRNLVDDVYPPPAATATNVTILDVALTNATRISVVATNNTAGIPQLKTVSPGYGMKATNESGTNIAFAVDHTLFPSASDIMTASNNVFANASATFAGKTNPVVTASSTTTVPLRIAGVANTTANYFEITNSAGVIIGRADTNGNFLGRYDAHGVVQTTDATVTSIYEFTPPANCALRIVADIVGARSDWAQLGGYGRSANYRVAAGAVTVVGTVNTITGTGEDNSAWDCTIDTSGGLIRIRVTGAAATTINWRALVRVVIVE